MTRFWAATQFDIPRKCDRCDELLDQCQCPELVAPPQRVSPEKQTAKVRVDRRKQKRLMTVVWGLSEPATDLSDLLSQLKAKCGAGGAIQDDQLEIQGDQLDRVKAVLKEIGYRVK